jgi:YgiT-type zinc finger domain-containing protein
MDRQFFEENIMKCVICRHGYTEKSITTVTLERNQSVLVFKQVPADICDNCGEVYLDSETNQALLRLAEKELQRGVFLEMVNFSASQVGMEMPLL